MKNLINALSSSNMSIVILLVLVGFFALIVLLVILLKKHLPGLKNQEKPKSDKEIAKEELDRVLEKVDDPETEKQMQEFMEGKDKEKDDKKEE